MLVPSIFSPICFWKFIDFKKLKFVSCGIKRIFVFLFSWLVKNIFKRTFPPPWTVIHSVASDGRGIRLLVHFRNGRTTGVYYCAQTCWGYLFTFGDRVSLCSPCCLGTRSEDQNACRFNTIHWDYKHELWHLWLSMLTFKHQYTPVTLLY